MAIPVARVHLAMAHAALPGLLPTSPRYTLLPLLPAPPCAIILPNGSPARPSRADAAERWDAYKIKQSGGVVAAAVSWPVFLGQQEQQPRGRVLIREVGQQEQEECGLVKQQQQQQQRPRRLRGEVGRAQETRGKPSVLVVDLGKQEQEAR
jgi:hypothetical protein